GALRAGTHEHLVLEADAPELMSRLDDGALHGVHAAPAGDRLASDQRLTLGATSDDLATPQNDHFGAHRNDPFHRPVIAASMQSRVSPNQAWIPMIAGR